MKMESCESNGTAYVVFREEKNVNELGNNVPSLVPYDYSSEEETERYSQHDVKSNVEGLWSTNSESPKSDSSGMSKESIKSLSSEDGARKSHTPKHYFVDCSSDDELGLYTEGDSDEDDVPGSPEVYNICTTDKTFDVPVCVDILKANGCSESSYLYQIDHLPGYFCAKLHKDEVEKVKGDSRVCRIWPFNDMCCC